VSDSHRPRAVLDADIIYSRVLHELIGRAAAELRLLDIFWSEQLLEEAQTTLIAKKQLPPDSAGRWVDHLRRNFPTGRIELGEPAVFDLGSLTSDPADAHVCALALAAQADYLFTHDRGYLRDALSGHGVQVVTPDEFLAPAFDADTQGMLGVLKWQANLWAGGRTIEELLDTIERAGAPAFAAKARGYL
jgi:predicted nucleic acid-binding protein